MVCPHCGFHIRVLVSNATKLPAVAPLICEGCAEISLIIDGLLSTITPAQMAVIKLSPAWRAMIAPAQKIIRDALATVDREQAKVWAKDVADQARAALAADVDRTQRTLIDGAPVTPDHREINPATGQQKDYVVLSAAERARGFVRAVRRTYTHLACGVDTTMGLALAETYARDPGFYSGTFCIRCRSHFPLAEFVWLGTNEEVGS